MTDLALETLTVVAQRLQARDLSPVELTRHLLDRITRLDPRFHSYVTVLGEQALAQARAAEADIVRGGYRGPLHGIPVAVKDLCCTKHIPTTCGAQMFSTWAPEYDSTVVEKLANSVMCSFPSRIAPAAASF